MVFNFEVVILVNIRNNGSCEYSGSWESYRKCIEFEYILKVELGGRWIVCGLWKIRVKVIKFLG